MGVRFPDRSQGLDFGLIQQARGPQQDEGRQQEVQAPANEPQAEAPEESAADETQQPQTPTVERAANDAGAQTTGGIIDMLA
jgi:hypothetical protein